MADLLFDVRHINSSGIGTYIRMQLPQLAETMSRNGLRLAILADEDSAPRVDANTAVVLTEPPNAPMYSLNEQRVWDHALKQTRPRAIWLPQYPYPLPLLKPANRGIATFVTVHDTIQLLPPEISAQNWVRRAYARTMFAIDARKCRAIFTPSEATAAALRQVARCTPIVSPIPVGDEWFAEVDPALSPVQGRYLLYVGNVKRHKNLPMLLQAFADVAESIPHNLVIAGGGESLRTLDERVQEVATSLGDRVILAGRLEFQALRALVAGAELLAMPSLCEGAGLPPLEAMASHTAVLASDIPAVRETCGDGADYFDPTDIPGLSALLRKYCSDDAARADLAARGWSYVNRRQAEAPFTAAVDAICAELRT
ncbi:glycosyltransferase family 1 protein [Mycolicibacterium sp. P1-5]|uniref:glycosyltransferase family 4 protein n=1 Tax=Mycolicibacterium sp. P1-5 TaxID=2024617 RepID=UPI0011EEE8DB|nr:glycosyltransferase family 1 protein [Mycolicibacterium sp. P1-5]KAA0107646.1 glycosyltransferase family 1 protein [Mycolicibacterium sp. P1-5]